MAMITVNGVVLPDPSSMQYNLQGLSASDSGRAESLKMYTGKKGEVRKISLSWNGITPNEASLILANLRPASYVNVSIVDPETSTNSTDGYINTVFYVSDITAPFQQWYINGKRYSKLSLDIIERK